MQSRHRSTAPSTLPSQSPDAKAALGGMADDHWSKPISDALMAGEPIVFGGLNAWMQSRIYDSRGSELVVLMDKAIELNHPQSLDFLRYIDVWHHAFPLVQTAIKRNHAPLLEYVGSYIDWSDPYEQQYVFNICGMYDGQLSDVLMAMMQKGSSKRAKGGWWRARTLSRKRREVWLSLRGRSSFERCVTSHQFKIAKILLDVGCVKDQQWNNTFERCLWTNNIDAVAWMWDQERMQAWLEYIQKTQRFHEHFLITCNNAKPYMLCAADHHWRRLNKEWGDDVRAHMKQGQLSHIPSAQFCQNVANRYEAARGWAHFHAFTPEINEHFLYACKARKTPIVAGLWPFVDQEIQNQACTMLTTNDALAYPQLWTELNARILSQHVNADDAPSKPRRVL